MIKTKDTSNQTDKLVERVKQINIDGMVCDSVFECDGWQRYFKASDLHLPDACFNYCPWCGKEINWDRERLGGTKPCLSCGCADEPGHVCQAERSG